jgi:hypothetical protein
LSNVLVVWAALVGVAGHTTIASAQAAQNVPPLELTAQIGYLPLYGGDATVGSISTWAASARVAYRLPLGPRHIALEAYLAHAPQDDDPYSRAPAFTFVGALARLSLRADARKGIDPFLGIGVGRMRVDVEEIDCPPPNCFAEGGPGFRDARLTTWALDAGALLPVARWFALRGDVRLYLPLGESSEVGNSVGRRIEYAFGLSIRL